MRRIVYTTYTLRNWIDSIQIAKSLKCSQLTNCLAASVNQVYK